QHDKHDRRSNRPMDVNALERRDEWPQRIARKDRDDDRNQEGSGDFRGGDQREHGQHDERRQRGSLATWRVGVLFALGHMQTASGAALLRLQTPSVWKTRRQLARVSTS